MKKVLVTGASGSIGTMVIKYLLSEGKYEITALDLKNKHTYKELKKYHNRINIIYGDINDSTLIEALVKDHDYIIHLASIIPPFSEISSNLSRIVEYNGTENIIKAINYYNKDCYLLYASTTSLYKDNPSKVKDEIAKNDLLSFSTNKYNVESLIKKKLKNYVIFRLPLVLNSTNDTSMIYTIKSQSNIEVTTNKDAAYAFVKAIDYKDKLNRKIFNIGMGKDGIITFNDLLKNILINKGLSFHYVFQRLFLEKNYTSPILIDSDNLDNIIHYRFDSLYNYYKRLKNKGKKRYLQKFLAKPIIYFKNKN